MQINFTKALLLILSSIFSLQSFSQTTSPQKFPTIAARTLEKVEMTFPNDIQQRVNIVILAFEQKTQKQVDTWSPLIMKDFGKNKAISYHEIPMMSGWYSPMSNKIDGWMKDGIPEKLHKHTATFYGDRRPYYKDLKIGDKSDCYVFILDKNGYIKYRTQGILTKTKEKEMRQTIASLLR